MFYLYSNHSLELPTLRAMKVYSSKSVPLSSRYKSFHIPLPPKKPKKKDGGEEKANSTVEIHSLALDQTNCAAINLPFSRDLYLWTFQTDMSVGLRNATRSSIVITFNHKTTLLFVQKVFYIPPAAEVAASVYVTSVTFQGELSQWTHVPREPFPTDLAVQTEVITVRSALKDAAWFQDVPDAASNHEL